MKWVKRIGIGLIVVVVVVIVAVMFFMGSIIKTGVETGGPMVLGVPVKLESARFRPLTGKVRLTGLAVGNPEGFKTPNAFVLGRFQADVNVASLFSDTIIIERILIEAPEITFEQSLKGSNIGALMKQMESKAPAEEPAEDAPAEPDEPKKAGKKVRIDDFLLQGARVNLSMGLMGGKAMPIPLPPIHLTDIGKGEDGATMQEAVTEIMGSVMKAIMGTVLKSGELLGKGADALGGAAMEGVDLAGESLSRGIEEAGAVAGKGVEAAGDAARHAQEALGDAAGSLGKGASKLVGGVGGLLKKRSPEAEEPQD